MDDVLFFGDEGGSWQIGVNWREVFPVYFRVLAETATADEFAYEVHRIIDDFEDFARHAHLERARAHASPFNGLPSMRVGAGIDDDVPLIRGPIRPWRCSHSDTDCSRP